MEIKNVSMELMGNMAAMVAAFCPAIKAILYEKSVSALPFSFDGTGDFPGTGTCDSVNIPGNSNCTIGIQFNPQEVGSYSETLTLIYSDGVGAQSAAGSLTGNAVPLIGPAVLSVSPASIDFGNVDIGVSADSTLTIQNTGGSAATSLSGSFANTAFKFKGGSYPGTGGTCPASGTVGAGVTCTLIVVFSPTSATAYGNVAMSFSSVPTSAKAMGTGV